MAFKGSREVTKEIWDLTNETVTVTRKTYLGIVAVAHAFRVFGFAVSGLIRITEGSSLRLQPNPTPDLCRSSLRGSHVNPNLPPRDHLMGVSENNEYLILGSL